ncbi:MAG: 4Fe-4S binding protein [Planctomycetes bacterium]|nr:4Fe-4S binding protein [Planctomycetota bacterium]
MAIRIRESECDNCGACIEVCPVSAIEPPDGKTGPQTCRVVWERCTECVGYHAGPRCAEMCPLECIESDPEHLENRDVLRRKWHARAKEMRFE